MASKFNNKNIIIKFIYKYLLIIVSISSVILTVSVYHGTFTSDNKNICYAQGTNRGFPIGFYKISETTSNDGSLCKPLVQDGFKIIYLLLDIILNTIGIYILMRIILWWISREKFKQNQHPILKSFFYASLNAIITTILCAYGIGLFWVIIPIFAFLISFALALILYFFKSKKQIISPTWIILTMFTIIMVIFFRYYFHGNTIF